MVDGIFIIKCREEYLDQVKEIHGDIDLAHRGSLWFNQKKIYFDVDEYSLLDIRRTSTWLTLEFLYCERS